MNAGATCWGATPLPGRRGLSWQLSCLLVCLTASLFAAPTSIPAPDCGAADTRRVRLRFTGDVMMHAPQIAAGRFGAGGEYRYESFFEAIRPYVSDADWTIGNLETTLVDRQYTGYPCFASPERLARALQWAGFDVMVTANNHCLDRREFGVRNTLDVLDAHGLLHAGTARSPEEHGRILMLDKNGLRVAVLAYTEMANGIDQYMEPEKVAYLVHFMRIERMLADMARARALGAEALVVFLHWGDEYQRSPASRQRMLAKQLAEAGADLIVGCHPHVLQPAVWQPVHSATGPRRAVVAYSLGNFISNQVVRFKDAGAILDVVLEKPAGAARARVADAALIPTWIHLYEIAGRRGYRVLPVQETLDALASGWEPMLGASPARRLREALGDTASLLAHAGADALPLRRPGRFSWPLRPLNPGSFHFSCSEPLVETAWDMAVAAAKKEPHTASPAGDGLVFAALGSRDPAARVDGTARPLKTVPETLLQRLVGPLPSKTGGAPIEFLPDMPAFLAEAELIHTGPGGSLTVRYARDRGFHLLVPEGRNVSTARARERYAVSLQALPKGALRPLSAFEENCLARWLWRTAAADSMAVWVSLDEEAVRAIADGFVVFEAPCAVPPPDSQYKAGWYAVSGLAGKDAPAGCEIRNGRATASVWPDTTALEEEVLLTRAVYLRGIDTRTVTESREVVVCGAPSRQAARPRPGRGIRMRNEDIVALFDRVEKGVPVLITRFPAPAGTP